ncbi:unnamed protein product [Rotaria sp. Silwood2]|nr:unnamed protein product [Rotaria sp. Silwood2]
MTLDLSSTHNLQQSSSLLIIQHLLFKPDKYEKIKVNQLKYLFNKLNDIEDLCEKNDPANIIQDEWLSDYIFHIPQDWLMLKKSDYQRLCDIHRNNRWSKYIWSRLITLSLSKLLADKWNETIAQLNEWMINVKHDIYAANDILTIIFVNNVFDVIISKHTKSVLFASSIGSILNYILAAKHDKHYLIDEKLADDFIQNVNQSIKDILSLNVI